MGVNKINVNNTDSNYTHSIFDISEYTGKTYDTLADALADIPDGKKKGGMTVSFVSTSDNKYVQYRLRAMSFGINADAWVGEEDELKENSKNLITSGGVYDALINGGYIYAGIATAKTTPDTSRKVFYIASVGNYENFGVEVPVNHMGIIRTGQDNPWVVDLIPEFIPFTPYLINSDLDNITEHGYYIKKRSQSGNPAIVLVEKTNNNDIIQCLITVDEETASASPIRWRKSTNDGLTWSAWKNYLVDDVPVLNSPKGISSKYIYDLLLYIYVLTGNVRIYNGGTGTINNDSLVDKTKIYVASNTSGGTNDNRFMHFINGSWEYFADGTILWTDISSLFTGVDDNTINKYQGESSEKHTRDFSELCKSIYNIIKSGGDYHIPIQLQQGTEYNIYSELYVDDADKCVRTAPFSTNKQLYTIKCPIGCAFVRNQYAEDGTILGTSVERYNTDFNISSFIENSVYERILIRKPDSEDTSLSIKLTPQEVIDAGFECIIYYDNIQGAKLPKIDDTATTPNKTWSSSKIQQELVAGGGDISLNDLAKTGLKAALTLNRESNRSSNFVNIGYFTDSHANLNDASASIAIMKQLALSGTLDYCVHGGDTITTLADYSYDDLVSQLLSNLNIFKNIQNLIFCKGNHDNGHVDNASAVITRDQYKMLYQNKIEGAVFNPNEDGCNYFYIDNEEKKFRLIVLDSYYSDTLNTINFGSIQENWLYTTALDFTGKTGWTVFVICHGFRYSTETGDENVLNILKAFSDKGTTYGGYTFDTNINTELVAVVHGHTHYDAYNNTNGFNDITVKNSYGSSPTVSIFTIDTIAKKIYETRIGDGNSRNYTY